MLLFGSVTISDNYMLASNILLPLIATTSFMPSFIKELHRNNIVAKDYYKKDTPLVADRGGIAILLIATLSLSLNSLFFRSHLLIM